MKLIKCLQLAFALGLTAGVAKADYFINWKIENSSPVQFDFAKVQANSGSYSVYLTDKTGLYNDFASDESLTSLGADTADYPVGQTAMGKDDPAGYDFRVELYGGEDGQTLLAFSETKSFDALQTIRCIGTDIKGVTGEGVWTVSNFTVVPEPTSGMLLLLGVAGLALRRRRV